MILRYTEHGLGINAWTPEAGRGLPDLWFSSIEDLVGFAGKNGYKLRRI